MLAAYQSRGQLMAEMARKNTHVPLKAKVNRDRKSKTSMKTKKGKNMAPEINARSTPKPQWNNKLPSSSPLMTTPIYSPDAGRYYQHFEDVDDFVEDHDDDNHDDEYENALIAIKKCNSILSMQEFPDIANISPLKINTYIDYRTAVDASDVAFVVERDARDEENVVVSTTHHVLKQAPTVASNVLDEQILVASNDETYDVPSEKDLVVASDEVTLASNPATTDATFAISNINRSSESKNHPLLSPCSCKSKNCIDNVPENSRILIHREFWRMAYNQRKQWIRNHVDAVEPTRRYGEEPNFIDEGSNNYKRNFSRKFYLPTDETRTQVCQVMFTRTLGYTTAKVVEVALKGSIMDNVSSDKRGKHAPKHKMTDGDDYFMTDHIFKFNPAISHYRREHAPKRLYLPSELTIVEMYRDYVQECEDANVKSFSYSVYQKRVKSFNISFAKLGEEQCEDCDEHLHHLKESRKIEDLRTEDENGEHIEENDGIDEYGVEKSDKRKRSSIKKIAKKSKRKTDPIDKHGKCRDANCIMCMKFDLHQKQYTLARIEYEKDKDHAEKRRDRSEMFLSVDMQKVILLPRLEQYKRCLFTRRIVVINQSFVPIGSQPGVKPRGVLWHEGVCGRKDEDVTSAFLKEFTLPEHRDVKKWMVWMDNCSGQNKCWTLFTMLVHLVNMPSNQIESVKLKYFTVGHTFMSADNFHKQVEKEMNEMNNVYDFTDFRNCVSRAGDVTIMDINDFNEYQNGLSQGIESKTTRPLLCNVVSVEFRRGSLSMYFKETHDAESYSECKFLKRKISKSIRENCYNVPKKTELRGVNSDKKKHILEKLGRLMPSDRRSFFQDLVASDAYDMLREV